jgi:hypothetical protein
MVVVDSMKCEMGLKEVMKETQELNPILEFG